MPETPVVQIRENRGDKKIPNIIEPMYKSPRVFLIHQDKIGQTFLTAISLKQGDVLSTILFNIYINDLPRR